MQRFIPVFILLAALFLRLTDLLSFPVFVDEATYVHWAKLFAANTPAYPVWMEGRILAVMWMALFDLSGAGPLWLARAVVALLSVLNCAACLTLGRWAGGRIAGWIAGGLYAVLPYALFHDRQAITDPVATAFGSVMLVSALGLARTRRWALVAPLGFAFAAAVLAKFSAAQYPIVFALALIFIPHTRHDRLTLALQFGAALLVAAASIGVFASLLGPRLGSGGGILADSSLSQLQCPPILCEGDWAEQGRRFPLALGSLPEVVPPYFGWPLIAAALFGVAVKGRSSPLPSGEGSGVRANTRPFTIILALTTLVMLLAVIVTMQSVVVPRYMGFMIVPLLVLAANGVAFFFKGRNFLAAVRHRRVGEPPKLDEVQRRSPSGVLAAVLALTIGTFSFRNSLTLLTTPTQVELPAIDRQQYLTGFYSGIGFREIAATVLARESQPLILTKTAWQVLPLNAYLDARHVQAVAATEARWPDAQAAFEAGRGVYVVEELDSDAPADAETVLTLDREGEAKALRLTCFTDLTATLFDTVFQRPDAFLDAYDQLIAETSTGTTLVPYPLHQATLLKERTTHTVLDLEQRWDTAALMAAVQALPQLRTVFLDDARFDPGRAFETWLAENFFHVDTRWYGPLRVVDWAGVVELDLRWQTDVTFGDGLVLRTVAVGEAAARRDQAARPGEPLRVRVTLSAQRPTTVQYKIFVHLIRDGQILSQHDGQPVADLRPTTSWLPGEIIHDQIALQIPVDLPPGEYRLRIGLYDYATGARLPVRNPALDGAEFYVSPPLRIK
ncbi:MAG: hypothetical protein ACT4QE_15920 [Anaerolineales bacterium]